MFTVLSLFTLYLFLMGNLPASFSRARGSLLEQAALTIGCGILLNYCLMLTGQPMSRVFVAGLVLALWGAARFWAGFRSGPAERPIDYKATTLVVCGIAYVLTVYYFQVLSEPLRRWDARLIWFFHAKMIWAEGALRQSAGWNHASLAFSNPDYPKLVPAIAAQLAYLKGYWNEFLPKASLVVMLVPLTLWVFSFRRATLSFILLFLTFFFSLDAWLWNGYMDGYLALYSGMALLLFGRYLSEARDVDLYSGMCALGIGANLKHEGVLLALCLVTALLLVGRSSPVITLRECAKRLRADSVFAKMLLLSIAPTVMWAICRRVWGLQSDLAGNPSDGVMRLANRLADGSSPEYVFNFMIVRAGPVGLLMVIVAISLIFLKSQKVTLHRGALVAATTSALYVAGIFLVYLSTPHDNLPFYLVTSAGRTMGTASVALLVSVFFLLTSLEVNERESPHRLPAMLQSAT